MKVIHINESDFSLVEVKTTNECRPTPHCRKHGAMNKITADGIWRCITVSGYQKVKTDYGSTGELHLETICRAGCYEIKLSGMQSILFQLSELRKWISNRL
jgi:hypothetical protein